MPDFCSCGADKYICQGCGRDLCSKDFPSTWEFIKNDSRGKPMNGNRCPACAETPKCTTLLCHLCKNYEGCNKGKGSLFEEVLRPSA